MLFDLQLLEHVFIPFLDGLPTVDRSCIGHKNSVLRKERCDGSCVAFSTCLVKSQSNRENLLSCLRGVSVPPGARFLIGSTSSQEEVLE